MKNYKRSRKFTTKKLLQKYLLIMFSLALVFSPFSSLGQLAYAEGDATVEDMGDFIIDENNNEKEASDQKDGEEDVDKPDSDAANPEAENANSGEDEENVEDSDADKDAAEDTDSSEADDPEATESNSGDKNNIDKDNTAVTDTDEKVTVAGFMMQPLANNDSGTTTDGFEWKKNQDGDVTITGYTGNDTNITIPDEIDGMPVTIIGQDAFKEKDIVEVTIPDSVKLIGNSAFSGSDELKTVNFSSGLETIGLHAFRETGLESIDLPDTVTTINRQAFLNSRQLTEVTLNEGLKTIGEQAFSSTGVKSLFIPASVETIGYNPVKPNIETIKVDNNNPNFKDINEKGLYTKDGKLLIQPTVSGEIADGTTIIGNRAFASMNLQDDTVNIPDSVVEIEQLAFYSTNIKNIKIPSNVKKIGNTAFSSLTANTAKLENIYFYGKEIEFGDDVFKNKTEHFTIYSYIDSDARKYATENGHTFIPFVNIGDEINIEVGNNPTVAIIDDNDTIQAKIEIPSSIANIASSFITMKVEDASGKAPRGLERAGAVLDISFYDGNHLITFENYKNNGNDPFTLSLLVNDPDDPKIYHQTNEDEWEKIGGTIKNNMITAEVWDFSTYGVFNEPTPPGPTVEYRDVEVTKVWDGTPKDSVTVYLVINGQRYTGEVAVLNKANNWNYSFFDIGIAVNGVPHDITVEEEPIAGYESSVSGNVDDGFVITNTEVIDEKPSDPADPEDPEDPTDIPKPEEEADDSDSDPSVKVEEDPKDKDGKRTPKKGELPSTATNSYNILLASVLLLIIGIGIQVFVYRKNRSSQ